MGQARASLSAAPLELRETLTRQLEAAGLFKEGQVADAAEALEGLLDIMDRALISPNQLGSDTGHGPSTFVKRLFGLPIDEVRIGLSRVCG